MRCTRLLHVSLAAGFGLLGLSCSQPGAESPVAHPYASNGTISEPRLFGEGIISTQDHDVGGTLTPDGRTLVFHKATPDFSFTFIVVSHFNGSQWTEPEVAPFSGRYNDRDPTFSPDGSRLFYASRRPVEGDETTPDYNIWFVERTSESWGQPTLLEGPVNSGKEEWYPNVTSEGTLYFCSDRDDSLGSGDVYRSRLVDGRYTEPENLGEAVNSPSAEWHALVAPDESWLIFVSTRSGGSGRDDLWMSVNREGRWMPARNLGQEVNSSVNEFAPKLSPDGEYLFFSCARGFTTDFNHARSMTYRELTEHMRGVLNGRGNIYQISLEELYPGNEE